MQVGSPSGSKRASYGVWIYDLVRRVMIRQTFEGTSAYPIWTPDGTRLTYNSTRSGGVLNIFWRAADGSGEEGA
jgi:Tol biopolymer transport system component